MKDCIQERKGDCHSAVLARFAQTLKYQNYCEKIEKNRVHNAHIVLYKHTGLCWYHEGIIEKPTGEVLELSLNRVVEVSVKNRELLRVNGKGVNGVKNMVLNLSDDGERWEGDVLNGEPYGWGVLYDSEGEKAYEGFRIGNVSVCYGIRYYSDIQKVEYEGEWCEGKRWGTGIQYDRNGNTVFEGEWMDDKKEMEKKMVLSEKNQLLHNHIEELIVSNNSCNGREWSVLDLSFMFNLRVFEVGGDCFENLKDLKVIGLNELERVMIGKRCFRKNNTPSDGHFYVKKCKKLKELLIDPYSFDNCSLCEIENDDCLEVISIGSYEEWQSVFRYASLIVRSSFIGVK